MKLVREVEGVGGILGAVLQKEPEVEQPGPDDLYRIGTAARILKVLEMPNGNLTVILHRDSKRSRSASSSCRNPISKRR